MAKKYAVKDSSGKVVGYVTKRQLEKNREIIADAKRRNRAVREADAEAQRQKDYDAGLPVNVTGAHSGKTYTITQKAPLTNEQIIEQNKKILSDLEEKRSLAKAQGNRQLEQELSQQYNDIARVTNAKIKEENLNIEKAKITTEFANLYPDQKAQEIVTASGLQRYITKKEISQSQAHQPTTPPPSSSSQKGSEPQMFKNRYVYDKQQDLWIDTQFSGSGAQINAADYKPVSFNLDVEEKNVFQKIGSAFQQQNIKYQESRFQSSDSYNFFEKGSMFSTAVLFGVGKGVKDIVTQPQEVVGGAFETFIDPVGSFASLSESFARNPGETIGYVGSQAIVFDFAIKGAKKGAVYVDKVNFEAALESGRSYDASYTFQPQESLLYGQSQLYPKTRAEVIGDVRSSQSSALKQTFDIAQQPEPVKAYFEGNQQVLQNVKVNPNEIIKTPYGTSNPVTEFSILGEGGKPQTFRILELESGKVAEPTLSEAQRFKIAEFKLREPQPSTTQTTLPEPTISAKPFLIVAEKTPKGAFITAITEPKNVRAGLFGTVAELSYAGLQDIKTAITREQNFKGYDTPEVLKTDGTASRPPTIIINANILNPEKTSSGSNTSLLTGNMDKNIQTPLSNQKQPTNNLFKPVEKYDLYQGVNIKQFNEQNINQGSDITIISSQDIGQSTDQSQFQDQIIDTTPALDPGLKSPDPFKPIKPIGSTPPPPDIIKPRSRKPLIDAGGSVIGFNVFVRRKGKFSRVSDQPLRLEEAKQFGANIVGSTAAATFKLVATKTNKLSSFSGSGNLRDFYQKGSLFIEKRSRRIKSRGEKEEITLKGLSALRFGKKKGIFGR